MFVKTTLLPASLTSLIWFFQHELISAKTCNSYNIDYPVTTESTIFWTNGGGQDSEWINKNNWQFDYLPGVHKFNRIIMAVNDIATVNCPATYMVADVSLEARSGATLDVRADLNIGDELVLKTNAEVVQLNTSNLNVGKRLFLAASYSISEQATLSIGNNLFMPTNGKLNLNGDSANIEVQDLAQVGSEIHGAVKFVLGPNGASLLDVKALTISSTFATLMVDASLYTGNAGTIPLIKFTSISGSFAPANIQVIGLTEGVLFEIKSENDGLYLDLTGLQPTTSVPSQTPITKMPSQSPVFYPSSNPVEATSFPSRGPSQSPVTKGPTISPSRGPSQSPVTKGPTISPSRMPSNSPVTKGPTRTPIISPSNSPEQLTSHPTDKPDDDSTLRIVLNTDGFDAISSTGICPAAETSKIVIDGGAYTAGPGIITLYNCASINTNFDLINIHLENFEEGLWLETIFNSDSITLAIKSLTDYSEYWARVRRTFVGEYPETGNTDHFPNFSWDTIPTWVRYRKNLNLNQFSDEELESIGKNHYLSWYGLNTPQHVVDIATEIKRHNDSHKLLLYWNAESYWGSDIDTFKEEWVLDGETGTGGRWLYDHSIPEFRDWWVNHAKNMTQQVKIDGEFTDNTLDPECNNGACDLETTVKSLMIKRLAEELPSNTLKLGNFLRQYFDTGNRFRLNYADGTYFENQHKTRGSQPVHEGIVVAMQLAREASWKKKVVLWTGSRRNCGCGFNNPGFPTNEIPDTCIEFVKIDEEPTELIRQDLHKSLGEFLMIVERWSYINFSISPDANCERWRWDSSDMEEFNRPLGHPRGPPLKRGDEFSRHFDHLSIKVNIATEETTLIWHEAANTEANTETDTETNTEANTEFTTDDPLTPDALNNTLNCPQPLKSMISSILRIFDGAGNI